MDFLADVSVKSPKINAHNTMLPKKVSNALNSTLVESFSNETKWFVFHVSGAQRLPARRRGYRKLETRPYKWTV